MKTILLNDYLLDEDSNNLDNAIGIISQIVSNGDTIVLKSGSYIVSNTSTLFIYSNIKLLGMGEVIIEFLNTNGTFKVKGINNFTIENFTIKNGERLQFVSSKNLKFKNISVEEFYNSGLVFFDCENVEIDNCYFNNIGRLLENSIGSGGYGVGIDGNTLFGKNRKIKVHDSYFTNTTGRGGIFIIGDSSDFDIFNNTFYETGYSAIALSTYNFQNIAGVIKNNYIKRCGFGLRSEKITVDKTVAGVGASSIYGALNYENDILVYDNRIYDSMENGIEGVFYLVENNVIKNTGIDLVNYPTPSSEGIFGARKAIGNYINNAGSVGIKLYSSNTIQGRHFFNNIIENCPKGIYINSQTNDVSCKNISVSGNYFINDDIGIQLEARSYSNSNTIHLEDNLFIETNKKYIIHMNSVSLQDSYDIQAISKNRFLEENDGTVYLNWIPIKKNYTDILFDDESNKIMRITGDSNEYGVYVYQDFTVLGYDFLINVNAVMKFVKAGVMGIQVIGYDIGGNQLVQVRTKINIKDSGIFEINSPINITSSEKISKIRVAILNRSANVDNHLDIYNAQIIIKKN